MPRQFIEVVRDARRGAGDEYYYTALQGAKGAEDNRRDHEQAVPSHERTQVETASDPQLTQAQHVLNFAQRGGISYGKIVYCQPYTHWYRVQLDDMGGDLRCCRLMDVAAQPHAVRDTAPLPVNTGVLVWVPPEGYGFILGAVPEKMEDSGLAFPDWIVQGGSAGFKRDRYYLELFEHVVDEGSVIDFSNGRPLDALGTDWGRVTDLGGGIHIDPFLVFLRQDETCGLFLHYFDRLARLAGYNFDLRTAISELTVRNDSGEGLHVWGSTPYPWEALGLFLSGGNPSREHTDFEVEYSLPYGKLEPRFNDQKPFYRYEEFRGYLGQGYMRHLAAPLQAPSSLPNTYSAVPLTPGLFREQIGLDGSYALASAHSIVLEKRSIIHIPQRTSPPESEGVGDQSDNYRSAGLFGGGVPHEIGNVRTTDSRQAEQEASGLADFVAHAFQWKGLHPFHYHRNDFATPETSSVFGAIQEPLAFSALLSQPTLPDPQAWGADVDHRYGPVEYFERRAGVYLLPRGGLVLRGGCGEEIKFSGGSIYVSCPGDVWLQPGRNTNVYAGDDLILKARNSVDVTASRKDVRLKAEQNMEFLSANAGAGRMLFESKAVGPIHPEESQTGEEIEGSGFLFKASHSQFVTACQEIYLRTGGESRASEGVQTGRIVLDAARGLHDIICVSSRFDRHMNVGAVDSFPIDGEKTTVNFFGAHNTQLMTPLQTRGGLIVTEGEGGSKGILCEGHITVLGGHIGTQLAEVFDGLVGVQKGEALAANQAIIEEVRENMADSVQQETEFFEEGFVQEYYVQPDQIGNADFQRIAEFSLRTPQQMNTEQFALPASYWQQLAKAQNHVPNVWTETPVTFHAAEMMPHPGTQAWRENASWLLMPTGLFNAETGREANRASGLYEAPVYQQFQPLVPDGVYPVVSQ